MPRPRINPDEETIAISIRLPASLRDEIQNRARKNRRSINQEVVWLLEKALQKPNQDSVEEEI